MILVVSLQLNRGLLLTELVATGMTAERAKQILDTESSGWGVAVSTGSNSQLDLTIEVFKPNHAAPVISAPFESVYRDVAMLWKQEFDTPKPKLEHKSARYTRQQEKLAAAMEERLRTEGLNGIQKQQMQQMFEEVLQKRLAPIEQRQQEVESDHSALAQTIENQTNAFQQLVPVLQQITAGWAYQQQIAYPGALYPVASMSPAASQQQVTDVTSTQSKHSQGNVAHSVPSAE